MKDIQNIDELRFHLTENMNSMILDLLIVQQMLNESKLNKKERQLLENQKKELLRLFRIEFQKHNVEQIKKYNELMNKKKKKEKQVVKTLFLYFFLFPYCFDKSIPFKQV